MRETPYPMMDYYRFEDAPYFYGREEETFKMVGEIISSRLLVLFSPSGSGKTSLIHAGIRPRLESKGYRTAYTRLEGMPDESVRLAVIEALKIEPPAQSLSLYEFFKSAIKPGDKPLVVFFDQFEEFFIVFENNKELRQNFINEISQIKYDKELPVFMVFSLREDYYASLHQFREAIPSIFQDNANLRLEPFTDEKARRVLEEPLKKFGWQLEEGLAERILADLNALNKTGTGIEPMSLQLVCSALWEGKKKDNGNIIDNKVYCSCGGAEKVLKRFIHRKLEEIPGRKHGLMVKIFDALKTPDNTKRYRSLEDIETLLKVRWKGRLVSLLKVLSEKGILREEERGGSLWYEFQHDLMVPDIVAWMIEREKRRSRRRLLYAVLPGIVLTLVLVIYLFIRYNTYYAFFSEWENTIKQQEIIIEPDFNPFNEVIETGYFKKDVKYLGAEDKINKRFYMGTWNVNNWRKLEQLIYLWLYAELQYKMGEKEQAIQTCIRSKWFDTLVEFGKRDPRVLEALLSACNDESVRYSAVEALGQIDSKDPRLVEALLNSCTDSNKDVRSLAVRALGEIGNKAPCVLEAILNACTDNEWEVRYSAVAALGKMGNKDPRVLEALLNASEDRSVRSSAVRALGQIDSNDPRLVEALLNACTDSNKDVRSSAVRALGQIKSKDPRVLEALLNASEDRSVRSSAVTALGQIDSNDPRILETLLNACKDESSGIRYSTMVAFCQIESKDPRVLEAILNACRDKDANVRSSAVWALGEIKSKDSRVLEALLNACNDKDSDVRSSAVWALGQIGIWNKEVDDALRSALKDNNSGLSTGKVNDYAAWALGKLYKDKQESVLLRYLEDNRSATRITGAFALASKDSLSPETIKKLNQLKDSDPRWWVRLAAWKVFEAIDEKKEREKKEKD